MRLEDIQSKLSVIVENLDKLRALSALSREEFEADFRNLDSTLHRLQTSIQALVDVAGYLVAELGLRAPDSSVDIIEVLREAGRLTDEEAVTFTKMVQFRNRVVHLYNRINADIVYEILTTELSDVEHFYRRLVDIITSESED